MTSLFHSAESRKQGDSVSIKYLQIFWTGKNTEINIQRMRNIFEKYHLKQSDLALLEESLASALGEFLSFRTLRIYFSAREENRSLTYLPEEGLLLIPLYYENKYLAMLRLDGVAGESVVRLMPDLEKLSQLTLEKVAMEKFWQIDPENGLTSEEYLFKYMENSLDSVREGNEPCNGHSLFSIPLYRLCLGLIVIRWQDEQFAVRQHDHEFALMIYKRLARILSENIPPEAFAAPLGRYEGENEFAILLNVPGRGTSYKLARSILQKMESENFADPLSGKSYRPCLVAGHALYPQDMLGEEMGLPCFEQAMRFRNRAKLAAKMAQIFSNESLDEKILPFASIIKKAGRILEYRQGRIRINLGKNANVTSGMRFLIWGRDREDGHEYIKGQLTVVKPDLFESVAEEFYLNKATCLPEAGDRLTLPGTGKNIANLCDNEFFEDEERVGDIPDILNHGNFLHRYQEAINHISRYVLIIASFSTPSSAVPDWKKIVGKFQASRIASMVEFPDPVLGKYGDGRIIILWPEVKAEQAASFMERFFQSLNKDIQTACGLAQYPYLDFGKTSIETNALKALEYGRLLPEPHIGIFDSMAMTISADKKFSLGDSFGAIEEYKQALLADAGNALARNSLGVCMAALGKREDAKRIWRETLACEPDDEMKAKVCYNLGTLCQQAGENTEASFWYRKCLNSFQKHVFAWLRMGQLNEKRGRKGSARRYYLCAANLSDVESEVFGIAHRYLARLDVAEAQEKKARSTLHKLLVQNPRDISSLNALAEMYLKENGDPAISEMLLRKSLQIKDTAEAWQLLAKSLTLLGKLPEAKKAAKRAENRLYPD